MNDVLFFLSLWTVHHLTFAHSLGLEAVCTRFLDLRCVFRFGVYLSVVLGLSSLVNYCLYAFILVPFDLIFVETLVFVLVIVFAVVPLCKPMAHKLFHVYGKNMLDLLARIEYLCLAVSQWNLVYLREFEFFTPFTALIHGVAVAWVLAWSLVLVFFIHRRLELARMPASLRNMPVTFIVLAFIAMGMRVFQSFVSFLFP